MAKLTKFKAQQVEFGTHYKIEETNRGDTKIKSITPAFGNVREPGTPETEEIYNGLQLGNVHTLQAIKSTNLNIDYYICNLEGLTEFGLNNDLKLRITVDNANTNTTTKLRLNNVDYTLLKEQNGTLKQIEAGDIHTNKTYELIYNGSQFVVINLFKNFESSYLDNCIKKTDFAEENKAGIISLSAVKGLIPNVPNATEYANGTVNLRQIKDIIDTKVPNATHDIVGKVMLGTTANTALEGKRLAEIIGLEFGGNLQDYGRKEKGKFYYDTANKKYYECIENNNLTYNDTAKFRAISNKSISDKVENLLEIRQTISASNPNLGTVKFFRLGKRVTFFVYFQNLSGFAMTDGTKIADFQENFFPDDFFRETEHAIMNRNNAGTENARLVIRGDGIYVYGVNGKTHYELKGSLHYIAR